LVITKFKADVSKFHECFFPMQMRPHESQVDFLHSLPIAQITLSSVIPSI